MGKSSVIIIGAGAAGLIAAKELSPFFEVTMLEAEPRIGGRLHTVRQDGDTIEAGAEFVHGNLPVSLGLLKDAGIPYVKVEGEMYRKKNGHLKIVDEMTEGWNELLDKMEAVTEDITMQELLDKYYTGPGYELLRKHARSYAEGFDLADITKASVTALYREWTAEDEDNYRITPGYIALSGYLQQLAKKGGTVIHINTHVKKVKWQRGTVQVQATNEKYYSADKLLVTVPVSVLQKPASNAYIHFDPPIHFSEKDANNIGFGTVIKVAVKFKKAFWQKDTGFILSDELVPTWWTQLPDKTPVLTGWLGGPNAAAMSNETDEAITEKALSSLAAIFDIPVVELKNEVEWTKIFNWQKEEYAMGAYSYGTLLSEKARALINTPLEETIFFAGEALYTGDHPGTVEAALVSGINIANVIRGMGEG